MATLVYKTIKPVGGDYASLKALSDVDADLVGLDEAWIVTCDNFNDAVAGANFDGWITDSTRYLRIVAADPHGSCGVVTTSAYRRTVDATTFSKFGNGGSIILDGLQLSSVGGAGAAANIGTVLMQNCIVRKVATGAAILMNSGATQTNFSALNSVFVSEAYSAALGALYQEYGIFKAYNCAFIHMAASGWGLRGAHPTLGTCALKNCYVAGVAGGLKDPTWYTISTCATSDASSPTVALRNIARSAANFVDPNNVTLDLRLVLGSALLGVGTDVSGEASPWNVPTDIDGDPRVVPYDIGPDAMSSGALTQFDNFAENQARWRNGKYASTVLVKAASPTDHPYVRMTLSPKDDSGPLATTTTRRVRNYYTIPPYYTWMQYRLALDLTTNYLRYREDGFRWYQRLYKDAQDIYLQAPCCVEGLIPVSFVHPSEPKAAERLSFSNLGDLNSLIVSWKWVPTFAPTSVETVQEIARIGADALNYVSVSMVGSDSFEREWDINDRYGVHEPTFQITKVRNGLPWGTQTLVAYYSYPGGTPGADRLLDDAFEFELVHKAGEVWGLSVRTAGLTSQAMRGDNTDAFASSSPVTLTYLGWGYFAAPVVKGVVTTEPIDGRGPGRTMLSGRSGVLRRMVARKQNAVLIGDRDPTSGNISTLGDNPYLQPDSFTRADSPDLGDKWSTDVRTGAGWYIEGSKAKCSGIGVERYTCLPREREYGSTISCTLSDNLTRVGVFGRYEYDSDPTRGMTCYVAYVVQTGANTANLVLSRFYKGVEYVLATEAAVGYVAGSVCTLTALFRATSQIYATLSCGLNTVTADVTDPAPPPVLTKPGRIGLYGVTSGPAEVVSIDVYTTLPLYTTGVT